MKTNHERGNALIYVLIAIALFAALSFVLARQSDTGDSATVGQDKAQLYATQLISYATQTKQSIDQMLFSGANIDDLDFTPPDDAGFNAGTTKDNIYMIYHPDGGGLVQNKLPKEVIAQNDANPPAGWYLGRFNNVDWSKTAGDDVILVAYQIHKEVCESINKKLDVATIPTVTGPLKEILIDDTEYTSTTNAEFTTEAGEACEECHGRASLCVQEGGQYAFYTIVADQ